MPNYIKSQLFATYRGRPADPAIFDTEFTNVGAALNSKAPLDAPANFTQPITVPPNATGTQVPHANEVYRHAFKSGTKMSFFQASAPLGWTRDFLNHDALLRVVGSPSGDVFGADGVNGGGVGGIGGISVGSPVVTLGHVLTVPELANHTHTHSRLTPVPAKGKAANTKVRTDYIEIAPLATTQATGGNQAHTHPLTSWKPKYIDMIVCVKD